MEQFNYSPEQFAGIIPELRVPDYVKPYSESMGAFIDSEKSILDDIRANYKIKEKNLQQSQLAQQQSQATETLFANLSKTFSEKALKLDAQLKEAAYDETFMEYFNKGSQERTQAAKQQQKDEDAAKAESDRVSGQLAIVARKNPNDSGALNQANQLTGYRKIAALNALALARTNQYPVLLDNLYTARKPRTPQEAAAIGPEAVKIFGQQTGFNQANENFLAKNVFPALSDANERRLAQWTSNFNITTGRETRSAAEADFLATGNFKAWQTIALGTTGEDGRMYTNAQLIARIERLAPNMSNDAWKTFGDSTNPVTKKPWREDPRWGGWSKIRRDEQLRLKTQKRREQKLEILDRLNGAGTLDLAGLRSLGDQLIAEGYPRDLVEDAVSQGRGSSQEVLEIQRGQDQLTALGLSGVTRDANGRIPFQAAVSAGIPMTTIYDAQRQGLIGPDSSNLTTVQRIVQSDEYKKDLKKDMPNIIASVDPSIQVTNDGLSIAGATNGAQFTSESMQWMANRAAQLMLAADGNMTMGQAVQEASREWVTYMKGLATDDDPNSNYYQNGQFVAGQPDNITSKSGKSQAAAMVARGIQTATLQTVGTKDNNGLFESDLQYRADGNYSERVKILARRFGMYPWQLVDQARRNRGLPIIPQPGQTGQLAIPSTTRARLQSVTDNSVQSLLRAQLESKQTLTGTPSQKAYAVGQFVQRAGGAVLDLNVSAPDGQILIRGNATYFETYFNDPRVKKGMGILSATRDPANPSNLLVVFK